MGKWVANCVLLRYRTTFLWEMLYLALFVPPGQPPLPRSVLRDPAIAHYVEGWRMRSGDLGLIALVDGAPVGAAWLRYFAASDPGYGFVSESTPELSVAVLPGRRLEPHPNVVSPSKPRNPEQCEPPTLAWIRLANCVNLLHENCRVQREGV
jgi:hypothetical protein